MSQADFIKKLKTEVPELEPFDDKALMEHVLQRRPDLASMITPDQPKDYGGDKYKGPDTFWGGVKNALNPFGGGEALQAGKQGAVGYAKGAIKDLPGGIWQGLKTIATTSPADVIGGIPGFVRGIPQGLQNISDAVIQAGNQPEKFGRTMGNITGQPLIAEGILSGAGMMKPHIGAGLESLGNTMEAHAPFSGMVPRLAEPRTLRTMERALGSKLSDIGAEWQVPKVQGEIVGPQTSGIKNARILPKRELPPSRTSFYGSEAATPETSQAAPSIDDTINARRAAEAKSAPTPVPQSFIDQVLGNRRKPLGLPEGNIFDMPASMSEDLGKQSPTAESHMNSPAETHNIPEESTPKGVKTTENTPNSADFKIVPKKTMSNVILKHMKDTGYEMIGVDEKGNFTFAPKQ